MARCVAVYCVKKLLTRNILRSFEKNVGFGGHAPSRWHASDPTQGQVNSESASPSHTPATIRSYTADADRACRLSYRRGGPSRTEPAGQGPRGPRSRR